MLILFILIALILGTIVFVSIKIERTLINPKTMSLEQRLEENISQGIIDPVKIATLDIEPFEFKSKFGYNLNGNIINKKDDINFDDGKNRVVVFVHGWTSNQNDTLIYYPVFYNLGFTIVLYDHRNHGSNEKNFTTMGLYESEDLVDLVEKIRMKFGDDCILGLFGESMGAATLMMASPRIPNLSFSIEDCGYSTLKEQIDHELKKKHLPSFPFYNLADKIAKMKYKFSFDEVRPIDSVKKSDNIPMLFIHGETDNFVPTKMVYKLYEAKKGIKKLKTYPNSGHSECYRNYQKEYANEVRDFLSENKLLN